MEGEGMRMEEVPGRQGGGEAPVQQLMLSYN